MRHVTSSETYDFCIFSKFVNVVPIDLKIGTHIDCLCNVHIIGSYINKAIRDGKYLAPPHVSAWQRSPHKIRKLDIFRDVISLLARVFILLIDTATQEVPIQNI